MQSYDELRRKNLERVSGHQDDDSSNAIKITVESLENDAELAWHVISIVTKKKTTKGDNGKVKVLNERAYPELVEEKTVGKVKSETGKSIKYRKNISTMRDMLVFRNKLINFVIGDIDDTFTSYYIDILSSLDSYAIKTVLALHNENKMLFDMIYEIDIKEESSRKERMKKARDMRNY